MSVTRAIHLPKGLYCLRVGGGVKSACSITPASGCDDVVEILRSPFQARDVALRSGEGVAIRCMADAGVELIYDAAPGEEPLDFVFDRLDPLSSGNVAAKSVAPAVPAAAPATQQRPARDTAPFLLAGHLARRGDVRAAAGDWLGGPETPARIEGLAFDAAAFGDASGVRYAVQTGDGAWSTAGKAGEFVGSRGRAMPIVRLKIELSEDVPALEVECLFLGARRVVKSGRRMEFSGPTGSEPLIGMRASLSVPQSGVTPPSAASASTRNRVKIFRRGEFA